MTPIQFAKGILSILLCLLGLLLGMLGQLLFALFDHLGDGCYRLGAWVDNKDKDQPRGTS